MNISIVFDEIRRRSNEDLSFAKRLVRASESESGIVDFCKVCNEAGIEVYPLDIADVDESAYAGMRRSTNGGGENSPHLNWEEGIFADLIKDIKVNIGEEY